MSFTSFMNDPKGYLSMHKMEMSGEGAALYRYGATAMTAAAPVVNAANGHSIQFTHNTNVTMNQTSSVGSKSFGATVLGQAGVIDKRSVVYVPAPGGAFPNLRILPWSGADVTFMHLNGTADFALTGPLTGCTVAVVRDAGGVWFFHANVSGGGGVGPANRATKRMMIRNAGALVGVARTANYMFCEYGQGFNYNGQGFVWGRQRTAGNWKFYIYEVHTPSGLLFKTHKTIDTKWADL